MWHNFIDYAKIQDNSIVDPQFSGFYIGVYNCDYRIASQLAVFALDVNFFANDAISYSIGLLSYDLPVGPESLSVIQKLSYDTGRKFGNTIWFFREPYMSSTYFNAFKDLGEASNVYDLNLQAKINEETL